MHVCLHFAVLPTLRYTLSSGDHSLVLYGFFSSFLKKIPSSNSTGFTCLTLSLLVHTEFSFFYYRYCHNLQTCVHTYFHSFVGVQEGQIPRRGATVSKGKTDLSRPFQMPLPRAPSKSSVFPMPHRQRSQKTPGFLSSLLAEKWYFCIGFFFFSSFLFCTRLNFFQKKLLLHLFFSIT